MEPAGYRRYMERDEDDRNADYCGPDESPEEGAVPFFFFFFLVGRALSAYLPCPRAAATGPVLFVFFGQFRSDSRLDSGCVLL